MAHATKMCLALALDSAAAATAKKMAPPRGTERRGSSAVISSSSNSEYHRHRRSASTIRTRSRSVRGMIAPLDRERLAKLLGLLGSEHDGEILAAAHRADALVRGAGLTWRDVLVRALPQITAVGFAAVDDITFCLRHRHWLTEQAARFVVSVREQGFLPTPSQRNIITSILGKARRRAEAA
jgi:hypothetical protein